MAKSNASEMLTSLDSLFTTQEQRDEAKRDSVQDIPISQISDFPEHPFKVKQDEAMLEMAESVRQYGVLVPGLVRQLEDGSYQMSILKSADGNGESVQRYFFDYPQPVAGEGHFISTYKHNGSPIPSFEGEPLRFACPRTIGDFAQGLWSSLNADNKVSLFARVIDLETGESGDMIFNKYDAVCSDLDDPEEPELLPEELELLKKLDAEEE